MSLFQSVFLGLIQGLTEFLPVSSSAHLVIVQHFLPGFKEPGLLYDILLHIGTTSAACIYFRKELKGIICSLLKFDDKSEEMLNYRKLAYMVFLGSIPTAIIGLAFKNAFESMFGSPVDAAWQLLITAALLWMADRAPSARQHIKEMTWGKAVIIGTAQGIAIVPGISRSGSTIAAGIFCKLDRDLSARYSFLLLIPAVFGATILEARHLVDMTQSSGNPASLLAGVLTAFVIGYYTIDILLRATRQKRLSYFAYYCAAFGLISLAVLLF
ncbi:MAG: undecaprenyl-diphosphatase UppP [Candidatus Schekmanbacteria bacterium]|nr:undecaprenyl-diphosphatase UppP [Candidatus Schekmanbacteria bacterium]